MTKVKYCPQCGANLVQTPIEGINRRACPDESCDYVFWNNPVPVVAAIVEYNGEIILGRNKDWPEKWYSINTGFLEKGETPEQGAAREVKEELGLDAEQVNFVGIYSFFEMNQLIIAYHVLARGKIQLGDEIVATKSIPPQKIRTWPQATGQALRDWLISRGYMENL